MKLRRLALLLALALPAAAQVSNPTIIPVTSAPSGACTANLPWRYVVTDGTAWFCGSVSGGTGTWTKFAGGNALGTVTNVSVVTANGLQGTVANPSTTPAITLSPDSSHLIPTNTGSSSTYLNGAGAYTTPPNSGGTVTTVGVATANGFQGTVANPTTTPAISVNVDSTHVLPVNNGSATTYLNGAGAYTTPAGTTPSGTANQVYATPNGSSGSASLRALVNVDLAGATMGAEGASAAAGAVPSPANNGTIGRMLGENATWYYPFQGVNPQWVQSSFNSGTGTGVNTALSGVAPGDVLLLYVHSNNSSAPTSIGSTLGNTYTLLCSAGNGLFTSYSYVYGAIASVAGGSETATANYAASQTVRIGLTEYTPAMSFDTNACGVVGGNNAASSVTITAVHNSDTVVFMTDNDTTGSAWTNQRASGSSQGIQDAFLGAAASAVFSATPGSQNQPFIAGVALRGQPPANGVSIRNGVPSFTAGTNVTSAGCATGYYCSNTRGELTIVGGTATTGTIATVTFSAALNAAPFCTVTQNGGSTLFSLGHGTPSTTAFTITAGISVAASTATADYSCVP